MSQLTPFQWHRQLFKIISTTAALWGLPVRCASVRPAPATVEKAFEPLRFGNPAPIDRRWQSGACIFQLNRF